MTWEITPTFDAAHRAALDTGKPLIYVCPPAGWALVPLAERLPATPGGPPLLVLAPDPATVTDIAAALGTVTALHPCHPVHGLARARRLLAHAGLRVVVATPTDALTLARASALPLADLRQLILAWPEQMLAWASARRSTPCSPSWPAPSASSPRPTSRIPPWRICSRGSRIARPSP